MSEPVWKGQEMSISMYKTSWLGQYPVGSGCYPLLYSDWGHWGSRIVNVLKKEKKKRQNKQTKKQDQESHSALFMLEFCLPYSLGLCFCFCYRLGEKSNDSRLPLLARAVCWWDECGGTAREQQGHTGASELTCTCFQVFSA